MEAGADREARLRFGIAMSEQTRMTVIPIADPRATVVQGAALAGTEDHDLVCGACNQVVAKGVSPATLAAKVTLPALIECDRCGAKNRVSPPPA